MLFGYQHSLAGVYTYIYGYSKQYALVYGTKKRKADDMKKSVYQSLVRYSDSEF